MMDGGVEIKSHSVVSSAFTNFSSCNMVSSRLFCRFSVMMGQYRRMVEACILIYGGGLALFSYIRL